MSGSPGEWLEIRLLDWELDELIKLLEFLEVQGYQSWRLTKRRLEREVTKSKH